jgi:hypothetical protein
MKICRYNKWDIGNYMRIFAIKRIIKTIEEKYYKGNYKENYKTNNK